MTPDEKERNRILKILEAHRRNFDDLGERGAGLFIRLVNLVNAGVDLDEEMKLPIEDRAMGFAWPDEA